jgi:hypothetical protein
MRLRLALLLFGVSLLVQAQTKLTVEQLAVFIRSAIQLKQPDKEVAAYLRKVTLTEKLEARTIEELQGLGAGPRTIEALNALAEASRALPAVPQPAPPPAPAAPPPPPSAAEQKRILDQVREYALGYIANLPDFLCTQVTRRYVDPSGMEFWRQMDTLTARVAYQNHKEDYQLILVNNHLVKDVAFQSVGGSTSAGEFGSMMAELFDPATEATFHWERWATLRGKRAHVYSYEVAKARSKWHVSYLKEFDIVPGYHGLVYVDRDSLAVLRIQMIPDLPPDYPLQQVSDILDYDVADISGHKYVLPLKAQVRMRNSKYLTRNDVEFRLYRKFSSESSISFDTPEPLPDEQTKEQPPK